MIITISTVSAIDIIITTTINIVIIINITMTTITSTVIRERLRIGSMLGSRNNDKILHPNGVELYLPLACRPNRPLPKP